MTFDEANEAFIRAKTAEERYEAMSRFWNDYTNCSHCTHVGECAIARVFCFEEKFTCNYYKEDEDGRDFTA